MENGHRLEAVMCTTGAVGSHKMEDIAMPGVSEYFPCEDGILPRKLSI